MNCWQLDVPCICKPRSREAGLYTCATRAFSHILGKLHNHKDNRNFGLDVCLNHFHIKESFSLIQKCFQKLSDSVRFLFLVLRWENEFKPQHLCPAVFWVTVWCSLKQPLLRTGNTTRALQERHAKTKENGRSKCGVDWILSLLVKELLLRHP